MHNQQYGSETIRDSVTAKRALSKEGVRGNFLPLASKQGEFRRNSDHVRVWEASPTNAYLHGLQKIPLVPQSALLELRV